MRMLQYLFTPLLQIKSINSPLYGMFANVINRPQILQNISARILIKNSKQCLSKHLF